ncbi:MAG TPA: M28 family peptidase [Gemmatimonadales bacterium]
MRKLLALVLSLVPLLACSEKPRVKEFDGPSAFRYLETQVGFGPRVPGTEAHRRMDAWLDSLLRQRADTLIVQRWKHVTVKGDTLPLVNFLARYQPAAQKRILLLAHWDSRPHADGPNSRDSSAAVPGANDGGSGVALLLGVTDVLERTPPGVGVDLLLVDGEDYGDFTATPQDVLIGSKYYAANQPPGPKPIYAVLFDLIADKDLQIYQEGNSLVGAPEVVSLVWDTAKELGLGGTFISSPRHTLIDDHLELQKAGLRAIDVVDFDYSYWHTPDDTVDKVSAQSLQIVGDLAIALIRREGTT